MSKEEINEILVIKSVQGNQFDEVLEILKKRFNNPHINVLSQAEISKDARITEVITCNSFSLFKIDWKIIRKIRRRRFDLMVILYDNNQGHGYLQTELLTLLCKPKQIIAYTPIKTCFPISFTQLIIRTLSRRLWIFYIMVILIVIDLLIKIIIDKIKRKERI